MLGGLRRSQKRSISTLSPSAAGTIHLILFDLSWGTGLQALVMTGRTLQKPGRRAEAGGTPELRDLCPVTQLYLVPQVFLSHPNIPAKG